jgi:hypothetical protein
MARFQTAPTKIRFKSVKRVKKSKKRKRGPASRARIRAIELVERKWQRLEELEEETRECYESVLERYQLSEADQKELAREWKLGLQIIADYEDATPEELAFLDILTYDSDSDDSDTVSELIEVWGRPEAYWRASFDLANVLELAFITIDEAGNINGERVGY